jgi:hypothetical protein
MVNDEDRTYRHNALYRRYRIMICLSGRFPFGLQMGQGLRIGLKPFLHLLHGRIPMKDVPSQHAHFSVLSYQ